MELALVMMDGTSFIVMRDGTSFTVMRDGTSFIVMRDGISFISLGEILLHNARLNAVAPRLCACNAVSV